jgi:hypothetical protein
VRDFPPLHSSWIEAGKAHAGIIVRYHQQTPIGQQIRGLTLIYASLHDGAANRLEVLEDRLRALEAGQLGS